METDVGAYYTFAFDAHAVYACAYVLKMWIYAMKWRQHPL